MIATTGVGARIGVMGVFRRGQEPVNGLGHALRRRANPVRDEATRSAHNPRWGVRRCGSARRPAPLRHGAALRQPRRTCAACRPELARCHHARSAKHGSGRRAAGPPARPGSGATPHAARGAPIRPHLIQQALLVRVNLRPINGTVPQQIFKTLNRRHVEALERVVVTRGRGRAAQTLTSAQVWARNVGTRSAVSGSAGTSSGTRRR